MKTTNQRCRDRLAPLFRSTALTFWGVVGLVGVIVLSLPDSPSKTEAGAVAAPDTIRLRGIWPSSRNSSLSTTVLPLKGTVSGR